MEDGAEGSVEAARVETMVGADGGGSHGGWCRHHGGWRRVSVEDGGAAPAVEKGAATVDPEKGAAAVVEEVGGHALAYDVLASGILASSSVSCTHGVWRPRVRCPRVVADEMYSWLPVSSRHGVVTGAVTNGDREREERTRCSADQERERRGPEQVRRRGGERDNDIM
jgi:hypothetical protein